MTSMYKRALRPLAIVTADKAARPQMRQVMVPMLKAFRANVPLLFDDLEVNNA